MKAIALTNKGIEDISALEIKELISSKAELKQGYVIFEFNDFKDLFKLSYMAQSITRVLYVLDLKETGSWVKDKKFAVKSKDKELAADIGSKIPGKVDLARPDMTFFIIEGNICLDFSGDISKRNYRIFMGSETLKSTSAYALLRFAGYNPEKAFLDPFCRAGTIAIEAALFACYFSQHFFNKEFPFVHFEKFKDIDFAEFFEEIDKKSKLDKEVEINAVDREFRSIQAAKKNAKIAGILKKINFSKNEMRMIDTKFGEKSIKIIATKPIQPSKAVSTKLIDKIYKELFYNAEYILKKKGTIAFIVRTGVEQLKKWAGEYKLKYLEERKIMQGKETWILIKFQK